MFHLTTIKLKHTSRTRLSVVLAVLALVLNGCSAWPEPGELIPTLTALAAQKTPTGEVKATSTITAAATPSPIMVIDTPTPLQTCIVTTGIEYTGALHLRACGGSTCLVVGYLHEGDTLTIHETLNGWYHVNTSGGADGWVNSDYCK